MAVAEGKISLSLGSRKPQSNHINGVKRSRAALEAEEDGAVDSNRAQEVSRFDSSAGGAYDDSRPQIKKAALVIAPQTNRDWKTAAAQNRRRQRSTLPQQGPNQGEPSNVQEIEAVDAAKRPAFGLNVRERESVSVVESEDVNVPATVDGQSHSENVEDLRPRTDEERAIDALLGREAQSTLVLPALNEEEVLHRDVNDAPDMATLDDYDRVPVEQFGAALLRGMGWKEGEGIGNQRGKKVQKKSLPQRRPALLGIGAKEDAAVAQELGTWGKAAKKGGEIKIYNPVLLRDKKTGEMFTEEELQKKQERDERARYEAEFDRTERHRSSKRDRRGEDRYANGRANGQNDSRQRDRDDRDGSRRHTRDRDHDRHRNHDSDHDHDRDRARERRRKDDADDYRHRRDRERKRHKRDYHGDERSRSHRHDTARDRR